LLPGIYLNRVLSPLLDGGYTNQRTHVWETGGRGGRVPQENCLVVVNPDPCAKILLLPQACLYSAAGSHMGYVSRLIMFKIISENNSFFCPSIQYFFSDPFKRLKT